MFPWLRVRFGRLKTEYPSRLSSILNREAWAMLKEAVQANPNIGWRFRRLIRYTSQEASEHDDRIVVKVEVIERRRSYDIIVMKIDVGASTIQLQCDTRVTHAPLNQFDAILRDACGYLTGWTPPKPLTRPVGVVTA